MPFRHRSSPTNRARRNREKDEETEEIEIEEEVIVEQTPESPATRDEDDIDSFFG